MEEVLQVQTVNKTKCYRIGKRRKHNGQMPIKVCFSNKKEKEVLRTRNQKMITSTDLGYKIIYLNHDLIKIGKVLDSPVDFYNDRIPKKQRKKTLVDELLSDAQFQKYNKRKYKEIIEDKQKTHYKAWRQAKRLKKKK
ncbi:hypothetical protein JTB14_021824 [Gonioctena quinquepunctata]|nr:hypothetical protein JTB14_021824 [Gonioctena quinquepunctata]